MYLKLITDYYILYRYYLTSFFFFQAEDGIRDKLVTGVQTCSLFISHDVFFFQAEDGIRDKLVTGVQTCALPISLGSHSRAAALQAVLRAGELRAHLGIATGDDVAGSDPTAADGPGRVSRAARRAVGTADGAAGGYGRVFDRRVPGADDEAAASRHDVGIPAHTRRKRGGAEHGIRDGQRAGRRGAQIGRASCRGRV